MDLLDFEAEDLYFDEATSPAVTALLEEAAQRYADGEAELPLLYAYLLAPRNLSVLVALYRFYYYQHRLEDTLVVADHALAVAAARLGLSADWQTLEPAQVAAAESMTLMRFYLLALKGSAYVKLRLDRLAEGEQLVDKLLSLDPADRLGCGVLKQVLRERNRLKLVVSH